MGRRSVSFRRSDRLHATGWRGDPAAAARTMDAVVEAAITRWPRVPDVHGWLLLDARGRYRVRAPDHATSGAYDVIGKRSIIEFIGRNYQCDAGGRWFFQNGPQRVFVTLAITPWIFRVYAAGLPVTHTGRAVAQVDALLLDEQATPILLTDLGPGAVDDRDLQLILDALADSRGKPVSDQQLEAWLAGPGAGTLTFRNAAGQRLPVQSVKRESLGPRFGFIVAPQAPAGVASG